MSDLVIPIASLIVLGLLSAFVFIPMINTANDCQKELKEIKGKLERLDTLENSLAEIDDTTLLTDLVTSKDVIPKVLKVSDFVYYIDSLAQEKNLTTKEISAGDVSVGGDTTEVKDSLGVSGPLSYSGSYSDILEFLDEIQGYSPYLVTLRNIVLNGGDNVWSVEFDLTGYYIPQQDTDVDLYLTFTPYTNFSEIIDIFELRASKLDE